MRIITFREFRISIFHSLYWIPSYAAMLCFRAFILLLLPPIMMLQIYGGSQGLPKLFLVVTWPAHHIAKNLARLMGCLMFCYGVILLFVLVLGRNYTDFSTKVCEYVRMKKK